jgi:hypothetical protein
MKVVRLGTVALPALAAFLVLAAPILIARAGPVLDQGYAGTVTVSGNGASTNGPVTIYDISYPASVKLGESQSIDAYGNFAVTVEPSLILGHRIVAVDASGARSAAMDVVAPPSGPAGPGD